ncbi:ComEA family DNA-binding protein [Nocardia stercoris]|uniref:ComEA family DNA-binding protein n=1 Tax=Nocardia stercoris TaxID=2483361 RepID=A0A3M2LEB3_9NOCA|nr:ComEA family DNA-binding protein [Nocardia stercoris]
MVPERFRGVRLDPGRRGVVVLALVGVAAVVVAGAAAQREKPVVAAVPALPSIVPGAALTSVASGPAVGADSRTPDPPARVEDLVVSVVGLVEHPGLLHIPSGSRVADALSRVGAADGADLTSLNLAQKLSDGDQIVVGSTGPGLHPVSAVQSGGATAGTRAPGTATGRVNLNSATEADLDTLPGVGASTARAILAWRTEHGRFTAVDQLGEVAGIGPSRLARLRALVTL